jgi:hypothetical protein
MRFAMRTLRTAEAAIERATTNDHRGRVAG